MKCNEGLVEFLIRSKRINKQALGVWLSEIKNEEIRNVYISKVEFSRSNKVVDVLNFTRQIYNLIVLPREMQQIDRIFQSMAKV